MDEGWRGWLAGIIDGEGWLSIASSNSGKLLSVYLGIANTSKPALDLVYKLVGERGRFYTRNRNSYPSHWSQYYEWRCHTADDVEWIIKEILPYLVIKH